MRKLAALAFGACLSASSAFAASNFPVFFQPWSAAIDTHGASTIALAAKLAKEHPGWPVIVTGSADTVGSQAANVDIAQLRAQVVSDALVADGLPKARIAIVATGGISSPGATAGTFAQFSRRVLIEVGN